MDFGSFLKRYLFEADTEYRNIHEFRRGGDRLDLQPYESYITEQVEHYINSGSLVSINIRQIRSKLNLIPLLVTLTEEAIMEQAFLSIKTSSVEPGMSGDEIDNINNIIENNQLRINSFGKTSELTYQVGGHYIRSFSNLWFMPADLTLGGEYLGRNLKT